MTTKRETLLAAVASAIDATNPAGTAVFRDRQEAWASGQDIAVVVRAVADVPQFDPGVIGPIDSRLAFAVDVISMTTRAAADDIAEAAYAAVMAGIAGAMDITPGPHGWDMEAASEDATILTMEFEILYRHAWGSLST